MGKGAFAPCPPRLGRWPKSVGQLRFAHPTIAPRARDSNPGSRNGNRFTRKQIYPRSQNRPHIDRILAQRGGANRWRPLVEQGCGASWSPRKRLPGGPSPTSRRKPAAVAEEHGLGCVDMDQRRRFCLPGLSGQRLMSSRLGLHGEWLRGGTLWWLRAGRNLRTSAVSRTGAGAKLASLSTSPEWGWKPKEPRRASM